MIESKTRNATRNAPSDRSEEAVVGQDQRTKATLEGDQGVLPIAKAEASIARIQHQLSPVIAGIKRGIINIPETTFHHEVGSKSLSKGLHVETKPAD